MLRSERCGLLSFRQGRGYRLFFRRLRRFDFRAIARNIEHAVSVASKAGDVASLFAGSVGTDIRYGAALFAILRLVAAIVDDAAAIAGVANFSRLAKREALRCRPG